MYNSQIAQDRWVHSVVGDRRNEGYFIEMGACDGIKYSNTLFFERALGWKGLCIEPNDHFISALQRNRTCTVRNDLVSDVAGVVKDFALDDATSGILDAATSPMTRRRHVVQKTTTTLGAILDEVGAPKVIDYFSLDVEGHELAILSTFPFDRYTFRCMTVEHNEPHVGSGPRQAIRALLESKGYMFVKGNDDVNNWGHGPIDDFYVHSG